MRARVALGLLLLVAAPALLGSHCGEPSYRDGAKCSTTATCPPGQQCSADGQCLLPCRPPGCTGPGCECRGYNKEWPYACLDDGLCHVACAGQNAVGPALTCDPAAAISRPSCSSGDPCVNGASCVMIGGPDQGMCVGQPTGDGGVRDGGGGDGAAPYQPVARHSMGATLGPDGRIYLLGGQDATHLLDVVEAYTPATGVWEPLPPLPAARVQVAAARGGDGRIFALGGFDGTVLPDAASFIVGASGWDSVVPLPEPRRGLVAVGNDKVWVFGGFAADLSPANSTWRLDPALETWSPRKPVPDQRTYYAAASDRSGMYVYLTGGYIAGAPVAGVLVYDPWGDVWGPFAVPPLPTARADHASATLVEAGVVVVGGVGPGGTPTGRMDVLAGSTSSAVWQTAPSLPEPRWGHAAVGGLDGRLYVFGGRNPSNQVLRDVAIYDPRSGEWQ